MALKGEIQAGKAVVSLDPGDVLSLGGEVVIPAHLATIPGSLNVVALVSALNTVITQQNLILANQRIFAQRLGIAIRTS